MHEVKGQDLLLARHGSTTFGILVFLSYFLVNIYMQS